MIAMCAAAMSTEQGQEVQELQEEPSHQEIPTEQPTDIQQAASASAPGPDGAVKVETEGQQQAQPPPPPPDAEAQQSTENFDETLQQRLGDIEQSIDAVAAAQGEPVSDVDARSIYVSGVDYQTRPEELQTLFSSCGAIQRITILVNKKTGHPKGSAYIEFTEKDSAHSALALNQTTFKGRPIKVIPKHTTIPFHQLMAMRGGYRGRAFGGFPRPRPYAPYGMSPYGRRPYYGGFYGGFRGRGGFRGGYYG